MKDIMKKVLTDKKVRSKKKLEKVAVEMSGVRGEWA